MASANLNFITFNQDHSCLAVGMSSCHYPAALWRGLARTFVLIHLADSLLYRHLQRLPNLPYRPLLQNIQQRRWQRLNHRNALFNLARGPSLVSTPSHHPEHKGALLPS